MIQQVDFIIAYLDTEQGKNLTPKQFGELLNEITIKEKKSKLQHHLIKKKIYDYAFQTVLIGCFGLYKKGLKSYEF